MNAIVTDPATDERIAQIAETARGYLAEDGRVDTTGILFTDDGIEQVAPMIRLTTEEEDFAFGASVFSLAKTRGAKTVILIKQAYACGDEDTEAMFEAAGLNPSLDPDRRPAIKILVLSPLANAAWNGRAIATIDDAGRPIAGDFVWKREIGDDGSVD